MCKTRRSKAGLAAVLTTLALLITTSGCLRAVEPGHEAVLVKKPVFFGHGGVDPVPVTAGRGTVTPDHARDGYGRPAHQ